MAYLEQYKWRIHALEKEQDNPYVTNGFFDGKLYFEDMVEILKQIADYGIDHFEKITLECCLCRTNYDALGNETTIEEINGTYQTIVLNAEQIEKMSSVNLCQEIIYEDDDYQKKLKKLLKKGCICDPFLLLCNCT